MRAWLVGLVAALGLGSSAGCGLTLDLEPEPDGGSGADLGVPPGQDLGPGTDLGLPNPCEGAENGGACAIAGAEDGHLQPVYGVALDARLIEEEVPNLAGYRSMGPVRKGNQAYEHIQHDVYGSVILAATQSFFDERLARFVENAMQVA